MKKSRNWLVILALAAGSAYLAVKNVNPTVDVLPVEPVVESSSPVPPTVEMCAFVWATREAPDLTAVLSEQVQGLDPTASASVRFFGEDCVYSDGRATFGVIETDFYIILPVEDLTTTEAFGNWISQVMPLVLDLPRESLQGRFGFVEFSFRKPDNEQINLRVPADTYLEQSQGKSGTGLFNLYYIP